MLARLLAEFGTRSAVMVGDRASDRDAAWENGLPHVHCAFGFAQGDENVEAEGRIAALSELEDLLARRGRWIEKALERLGVLAKGGMRVGVSGGPAAGKSLWARDAARLIQARGRPAVALSLAHFERPEASPAADAGLAERIDLPRLAHEVLRPHEAGAGVNLAVPDLLGQTRVEPDAVVVLEGSELLGAKLLTGIDRLVHLDLPETVSWRRREGRSRFRPLAEARIHAQETRSALERERALERRFPPRAAADLVLDGTNPLGPH
jgi:hypothetical protein